MDAHDAAGERRNRLIVLLVMVLLALWAVLFDWNWIKGSIEARVQAATGREFEIGGDLDVDVAFTPTIRAQGLRLGNAAWSGEPDMLTLRRLEFELELLPLLRGEVVLPRLAMEQPRLLLERREDGEANWLFGRDPRQDTGTWPRIDQLLIGEGELRVLEHARQTDLRVDVRNGKPQAGQLLSPVLASGTGRYRGSEFSLEGTLESPLHLREQGRPYQVDLRARAGATRAHAAGSLPMPLDPTRFDLHFALSGDSLGDLYELIGIALPDTPPYRLSGQLSRKVDTWRYDDFSGRIGDSDLSGATTIEFGRERPLLTARLRSGRLDFDDLAPLVGAPPQTGAGETASAQQRKEAARMRARDRLLPDREFDLARLRAMDADVELEAAQVQSPQLPIRSLSTRLALVNGHLKLQPLRFDAAGGRIDSWISLDGSRAPIHVDSLIHVRNLALPQLLEQVELARTSTGRMSGEVKLAGRGNSVAAMLGSADGEAGLIMGSGRISNLLIELLGLDVGEAFGLVLGNDRMIAVRCAYADFAIDEGTMYSRSLVFDTSDTVVHGEGTISLRDERFDLRLLPRPKDKSLLALRTPLTVQGSFRDPDLGIEGGPIVLRGIAAAALYSLAPPAALLALVETGPGEDFDCGEAARLQARRD